MSRPKALDLFCGAGGASMGLHRAGFDVTGVDIRPQPRYPFTFVQADAMMFPLEGHDLVWASPPCQRYSSAAEYSRQRGAEYPDLIAATRCRLEASGVLWVIENVPQAPVRPDVVLDGTMFGLRLVRRRHFELGGFFCMAPGRHRPHPDGVMCVVGHGRPSGMKRGPGAPTNTVTECREAMGIDWMDRATLVQAIPPAYSELIGRAALVALQKYVPSGEVGE
jgi:DNA (cytosine-5)-methyltransferase 1